MLIALSTANRCATLRRQARTHGPTVLGSPSASLVIPARQFLTSLPVVSRSETAGFASPICRF